jgi:hypothetical protein
LYLCLFVIITITNHNYKTKKVRILTWMVICIWVGTCFPFHLNQSWIPRRFRAFIG